MTTFVPSETVERSRLPYEDAAFVFALLTLVGSLFLSMGMGLNACPLCFYQRTFIMGVVSILGMGKAYRLPVRPGTLSLLALPLALSGLGVALAHSHLVWSGTLVCPEGILGAGPAPYQSLVSYIVVTLLLIPGARSASVHRLSGSPKWLAPLLLAAAFTALSVLSSPPIPPFKPTYDAAGNRILKVCERAKP